MVGVTQHLEEGLPGLFTLGLLTYPLTDKIQQVLDSTKRGFRSSGTKTDCQFGEEYFLDAVPSKKGLGIATLIVFRMSQT